DPNAVEHVDVDLLSQSNRQLLNVVNFVAIAVGMWMIWSEIFPGISMFDSVVLWQQTVTEGGVTTIQNVTLTSLFQAFVAIAVTVLAARNLPSLIEVILLERIRWTFGARYAAVKMLQYVSYVIGTIIVANLLGMRWSQLQWLVAALGVGIGFGLQDVVANYISGIIILFERPIRVGDVVSVGGSDGTVTGIQMRTTTIRTFDRKELLVPNREFISGQLLNWSLTDAVTRILINVGIAYGSDTKLAMSLMIEACRETAIVLNEPEPSVTFDGFGDNALSLSLRCFCDTDDRLPAISLLHSAIDEKFANASISIAFPQRDLHLDVSQPIPVEIGSTGGALANTAPASTASTA
ncbi:MAG: mechanosensitive ion channel, partial [Gammaproteobacteria bacterium]|nr:mechanosensitive ion channel [Gammaproteobacteria bacterium]